MSWISAAPTSTGTGTAAPRRGKQGRGRPYAHARQEGRVHKVRQRADEPKLRLERGRAATASARSSVLTAATRLGDSVAQNVEDGREIRGELMVAQVAAEARNW